MPPQRILSTLLTIPLSLATAAAAEPPQYRWQQITPTSGGAAAVNDSGIVVGWHQIGPASARGFAWANGLLTSLEPPAGFDRSAAAGISAGGLVAGTVSLAHLSEGRAAVWQLGAGGDPPIPALLPIPSWADRTTVTGMNAAGVVVGYANDANGAAHPVRWSAGPDGGWTWEVLSMPAGATGLAFGVNRNGVVAGGVAFPGEPIHPVLWPAHAGGVAQILSLPELGLGGWAAGVNDAGDAVGLFTSAVGKTRPALWLGGGFSFEPGIDWGMAVAINHSGQAVGVAGDHAVTWVDGVMYQLDSLLEPGAGGAVSFASGINDGGIIVGSAWVDQEQRAVVLIPIPAPATSALLSVAAAVALRRRRSAWACMRCPRESRQEHEATDEHR